MRFEDRHELPEQKLFIAQRVFEVAVHDHAADIHDDINGMIDRPVGIVHKYVATGIERGRKGSAPADFASAMRHALVACV